MTYVATPPSNASNHPKFSLCHRRFEWRNRKSFASPFDLLACLIRPTRTTLRREREKKEWKRRKKFMNKVIFSHRFHYPRRKKGNFVTDAKVQREKERAILFIFPPSHLFCLTEGIISVFTFQTGVTSNVNWKVHRRLKWERYLRFHPFKNIALLSWWRRESPQNMKVTWLLCDCCSSSLCRCCDGTLMAPTNWAGHFVTRAGGNN